MLEAVEFPARVAHLDAALADMDGDDFSHFLSWFLVGFGGFQLVLFDLSRFLFRICFFYKKDNKPAKELQEAYLCVYSLRAQI